MVLSIRGRMDSTVDSAGYTVTGFVNLWDGTYGLGDSNYTNGYTCHSYRPTDQAQDWLYSALCPYAIGVFAILMLALLCAVVGFFSMAVFLWKKSAFAMGLSVAFQFMACGLTIAAISLYAAFVHDSFETQFSTPLIDVLSLIAKYYGQATSSRSYGYSFVLSTSALSHSRCDRCAGVLRFCSGTRRSCQYGQHATLRPLPNLMATLPLS